MRSPVVIFTHSGDLHASYFCDIAAARGLTFRLIFTDRMSVKPSLRIDQKRGNLEFFDTTGTLEAISLADVVWWRRISGLQQGRELPSEHAEFIYLSWQNLFEGDLSNFCKGTRFVNDPIKSRLGYNKVSQLLVARDIGFRVPETIVTNDPEEVISFSDVGDVIVKPLISSSKTPIYVNDFDISTCTSEQISVCPLIYQQKIQGTVNYRVNVFGSSVYAFEVRSENMDWRKGEYKTRATELNPALRDQCISFTKAIGLEMCCIDLRMHNDGYIYFLEGNPQGQFLFLEASSGFPIMERFVDFIYNVPTGG